MRSRSGFSLVEVMIAALILGIGVIAGIRLFGTGMGGVTGGRNRSTATTIAIQRLESLGAQGIDQLPACLAQTAGCQADTSQMTAALPGGCTEQISENGVFRVDTVVQPHPDAARQPGARIAIVSVCWTEDLAVHQVQLQRIFAPDL